MREVIGVANVERLTCLCPQKDHPRHVEKWKGQDGNQNENTEWHNIVAWKRLAEICSEFLVKGSKVYIEGKLQTRKWQDKDGNDKYTTEIVAREMQML